MKFVNLTPHTIHLPNHTVEASGQVARCEEKSEHAGSFYDVPVYWRSYGEVTDLPEPENGTMYIVSMLVRLACPDRTDLASPGDMERDAEGKITGAKNLVVNRI